MSLIDLSLLDAAAGLRAGSFTSLELTRACLERIHDTDKGLHAFLTVTADRAQAQARQADERLHQWRADGSRQPVSPLLGVPLAIKDVLCIDGVRTTCGSRMLESYVPPYTATAVQRLESAGAVVLGKTNTDEFAMGSSTENSAFGPTHNPWDAERVPGGSSGGSAAAVTARQAFGALGTDTGGSVRQPAALCGCVGFKPSYGRVSRYGLVAFGSSLDQVGTFGRSVADAAVLYHAVAGHDPRDSTSVDLPVPPLELDAPTDLSGLRLGVPEQYFIDGMQPEVDTAVRAAIAQLESLGARAKPVSLPHTRYALPVYYLIAPAEASANLARYDGVRLGMRQAAPGAAMWDIFRDTRGAGFGPEVKRRIMLGTYALSAGYYDAYYGRAQKVRTLIKGDFERAFEQVDVIACPVAPHTAFKIGEKSDDPLAMYLEDVFTLPASLAGIPGLSLPCGTDTRHLPIGLQLLGPQFDEAVVLRVGHAYQRVTQWHQRWPEAAPA